MAFRAGHRPSWRCTLAVAAATLAAAPSLCMAADKPYAGDLGQGIAALVIFVLLLLLLGKYAWRPVIEQLKRREEDIQRTVDKAKDREAKADELAEEYQQRMDNVDVEIEQLMTEAKRTAALEKEEILAQAKDDARSMRKRAREAVQAAEAEAQQTLQTATAQLATKIAQQVLRRNLTADDHSRLVEEAGRDIASHAGEDE